MDIIASHQLGLVEQLEVEAASLAGRPRDHVQRAIVYHHLFDHSGGRHGYALLAAQGTFDMERALDKAATRLRRSWWRYKAPQRMALADRLKNFGAELRALDALRCEAMVLAYRLAMRPGLARVAEERLTAAYREALSNADRRELFLAQQAEVERVIGLRIEAALIELGWIPMPKAVAEAVACLRIDMDKLCRAERKGLERAEARLKSEALLPAGFAANPGQSYYALQRSLAEKRRRDRCETADMDPEEAVILASAA